ncbi:MAG TPA: class I SAM-dependent methyltransferase [Gaiellaceae bacterium]|jgi:SAM-dependent methyltransferase|nr:class I SAM-dependent methyltransferase [Gaiellaceae bacterium]
MTIDPEIRAHYELGVELKRLEQGGSLVEFLRTKELLSRYLPDPPARVLDVGGGPGAYAVWLADAGYDVRLVDAVPLHVAQAREQSAGRFTAVEGDARELTERDETYDAVLLLGPLYHLTARDDRLRALREARRVLRRGGIAAAAAISRFASLLDGLLRGHLRDDVGREVVEHDLATGVHRSPPDRPALFTTAYFHLPGELRAEVEEAGLAIDGLFGIEGPGWLLGERLDDELVREDVLAVARAIEQEPSVIGASGHLLAIAHRP